MCTVTQKKDIKQQKDKLEQMKKEAEQEKARAKQAARERVLSEFEKGQLGLAAAPSKATTSSGEAESESALINLYIVPILFKSISATQAEIHIRFIHCRKPCT